LISLTNISVAFGGPKILDNLSLRISKKQRVCLLGRNGCGKTTLMKIIEGQISPDTGEIQRSANLKVSYFAQKIPDNLKGSAFEIIAAGLGLRGELLIRYHAEAELIELHPDHDQGLLHELHVKMDEHGAWSGLEEINKIISRMSLNGNLEYMNLSGGQKRRVLLAAALVSNPDILLLDEPTNHLDIEAISWMEDFLLRSDMTILFVTHDRMLLRSLATRIIELDRGQLVDWSCNYDTFLQRRQAVLDNQEKEWERFDKKLAREEIWIRKGIRARRTRDEGRVRALEKMRKQRKARRVQDDSAKIRIEEAGRSGKLVIQAKNVSFGYDDRLLINNLNIVVSRGDKIGIIGPNGCGKTTLIKLLLGDLSPVSGEIKLGTNLAPTYFDQLREQLDEEKTVTENVTPGTDFVMFNGQRKHIISYLQDFLFTPERAAMPIKMLSGGERNRLLLAKLFTLPSNFLILDEPTNDLDAETLELLEELLVNFDGTILLICHDRTFLNNVVTSTLVFSEKDVIKEYVGGYDDWQKQLMQQSVNKVVTESVEIDKKQAYREAQRAKRKKKLTFSEKNELKALPGQIEELESEQGVIHAEMSDPEFFKDKIRVVAGNDRLLEIESLLQIKYERWEQLENIAG